MKFLFAKHADILFHQTKISQGLDRLLQSRLEILRHILRLETGEFSSHLLYNTRYGR